MSKGWISLHRKIKEHWIWDSGEAFTRRDAWIDLLLRATHSDKKFLHGNNLITLKGGEFITSERKLSEDWGWSRTKVCDFLRLLQQDDMINHKKTRHYTRISICNYSSYQGGEYYKKTTEKPGKNQEKTSKEPQKNTINNDNNVNNENKGEYVAGETDDFPASCEYLDEAEEIAQYLLECIISWKPDHRYARNKPSVKGWIYDIEKAIRLDGRTPEQLFKIIDYTFTKSTKQAQFWAKNIWSGEKLRAQYDRMAEDYNQEITKAQKNGKPTSRQIAKNAVKGFENLEFETD